MFTRSISDSDRNIASDYELFSDTEPTNADITEIRHNLRCGYLSGRCKSRNNWTAYPAN